MTAPAFLKSKMMVGTDDMVVLVSEMPKDRMFDDEELLLIQQGLRALRRCSIRGDFGIFKLGNEELRRIQEINRKIQMIYLESDKE